MLLHVKIFSTESQISTKIIYSSGFRQYFDETINYLLFYWNEKSVAESA